MRNIIKIFAQIESELKEQEKQLFKYLLQHKCDEATFNENKEEIRIEIEKLEKSAEKYEEDKNQIEDVLDNITKIVANAGVLLKSPIVEEKRAILNLLLSDCKVEGKNLCFSITKPFDKLLKTSKIEEWCRQLSNYRADEGDNFHNISTPIELFQQSIN